MAGAPCGHAGFDWRVWFFAASDAIKRVLHVVDRFRHENCLPSPPDSPCPTHLLDKRHMHPDSALTTG
jgi:hypothetical protein